MCASCPRSRDDLESFTLHIARGAAALAAAMGIGRFVYTPILPLMTVQAGLSPAVGYLAGAWLRVGNRKLSPPPHGADRLVAATPPAR